MNPIRVVECVFKFRCDKRWEDLSPVPGREMTRHCADCQQSVYFVETDDALRAHAAQGHCVAMWADRPGVSDCIRDHFVTAGVPAPEQEPRRRDVGHDLRPVDRSDDPDDSD